MVAALLALVAAVLIGTGSARQHAVALGEEAHEAMDPRLVVHLAQRPGWRLGIAMSMGGFACMATAIATGRLVVVEPLGATQVLFALLYASRSSRTPLRPREWRAIAATVVGLAGFLVVAAPTEAEAPEALVSWAVPIGVLVAAIAVGVVLARRFDGARRGVVFAVLAGLGFGTADALIKLITDDTHGILTHWPLYAWMVLSPLAFLFQQSAYHSTHLGAAMPATSTLAPTTATLLGALMFGEQLRGGWAVPVELAFFALLLVGVATLARSDVLEGPSVNLLDVTLAEVGAGPGAAHLELHAVGIDDVEAEHPATEDPQGAVARAPGDEPVA